ncbi:MAG: hypothetical protein IGS03_17325 [Candidatus Sericytochromatia bacterium]|nr:hypothetical protein [Candidatus Sericytochromatia bacterium]
MAGLRDILRRAFGGRPPEEALAAFKEKMHDQINAFKDNPEGQAQLRSYLQSFLQPLQYFNMLVVRPALNDNDKMREMAQKYGVNKVELKRVFKIALELEDKVQRYFQNPESVDQLIITLRKVVNVLDEQILTDVIEALDYNIDYNRIEKAYLDYQTTLQQAYNVEGLNRDLQGILGGLFGNLKNVFATAGQTPRHKPSDKHAEVRMLEPELQNLYDRQRQEGFSHEEAMATVTEKRDLDALPKDYLEAYRTLRQEGRPHADALAYVQNLAQRAAQDESHG